MGQIDSIINDSPDSPDSTINVYNKNFNMKLYGQLTHEDLEKNNAIPEFYIAYNKKECKNKQNTIVNKSNLEQYGKITKKIIYENGDIIYQMDYGHYNFHESFLPIERLRKLTEEEMVYHKNNQFWKLPQQFYQSAPS